MRKAVGDEGAWFETESAESWELPVGQTLWHTETGAWVLESKPTMSRRYGIEVVPDHHALTLFTRYDIQIPSRFLDDAKQI